MRWDNTYIAGVGTALGEHVTVADAVRAGACSETVAQETGQTAVCVACEHTSDIDLASLAAWAAINDADRHGEAPELTFGPLFHAGVAPSPDGAADRATRVYTATGLPSTSHPVTTTSTGRHGVIHGLAAAAAYLPHTDGTLIENALVTASEVWSTPDVDRWGAADVTPRGDGGGAMVVSRRPARAQLLSTATRTDPALHHMRTNGAPAHKIHLQTSNAIQLALAIALEDARLDDPTPRYVITPFLRYSVPNAAYLSWAISDHEHLTAFTEYGLTTGHLGAADLIVGLSLLGTPTVPIDDGEHVVLLADDGGASAAAAVIRF